MCCAREHGCARPPRPLARDPSLGAPRNGRPANAERGTTLDGGLSAGRYDGHSVGAGRKDFRVSGFIGLIEQMTDLGLTALHLHLTETDRAGVQLPGFVHLATDDA